MRDALGSPERAVHVVGRRRYHGAGHLGYNSKGGGMGQTQLLNLMPNGVGACLGLFGCRFLIESWGVRIWCSLGLAVVRTRYRILRDRRETQESFSDTVTPGQGSVPIC